ncbi:hypothetical protein ACFSUS_08400 [Spirosoma soli]|uniref:Uncharacterized protein n=1 Tax=Spirosoma soli TaxID=1770529 RepID=A0ABW5M0T2_9BACT
MEKLNPQQVARLYDHLIQTGTSEALIRELLDHLACEVEYYMWIGLPFESALDKTLLEADAKAVGQLRKTYQHELTLTETQLEEASFDDIIFQHRNKAYGAYDLRQTYPTTLRNAIIMTLGLCMMLMALVHMISRGTWSYLSLWGAIWLVGLGAVTFVGFSWYLQHERQNQLLVR